MDGDFFEELIKFLYSDVNIDGEFYNAKPLLAHYSSIEVVESILKNEEVWLSNPLYMNDHQEVKFGFYVGVEEFRRSDEIRESCNGEDRYNKLINAFNNYCDFFENEEAIDIYIFCLSEHDREDIDGKLSMWRGYGGNGSGACIVFDSAELINVNSSPLILARVSYFDNESLRNEIKGKIQGLLEFIKMASDEDLHKIAYYFMERLILMALYCKHKGFSEEREWRISYIKSRISNEILNSMCGYFVGKRGIEPKLRLKIGKLTKDISGKEIEISSIIKKIILGPTISAPIYKKMVEKMLVELGKGNLVENIESSTIPYRQI